MSPTSEWGKPAGADNHGLTLDERLTAAAIIMRDAIEKHDGEAAARAAESAKSPQNSQ